MYVRRANANSVHGVERMSSGTSVLRHNRSRDYAVVRPDVRGVFGNWAPWRTSRNEIRAIRPRKKNPPVNHKRLGG